FVTNTRISRFAPCVMAVGPASGVLVMVGVFVAVGVLVTVGVRVHCVAVAVWLSKAIALPVAIRSAWSCAVRWFVITTKAAGTSNNTMNATIPPANNRRC